MIIEQGTWKSIGTVSPGSSLNSSAVAGSDRCYYLHSDGRYCYRYASWGTHGTKLHGFRDYGTGRLCDEDGRDLPGEDIPESEFA